jgi:hypothetical protein
MVGWTLREISDAFNDHGFSADYSYDPPTSGERRSLVEQFYVSIDWSSHADAERILGVYEALIDAAERNEALDPYAANVMWSSKFTRMLARDGIERDGTGRLRPAWASVESRVVGELPAESSIPMLLRRMWINVEENPDAAIGAAKEAIEATAKYLITENGEQVGASESMPSLVARAQQSLGVHAKSVTTTKKSAETIKSILGALSHAALGVNELRRDYGTGHGRPTRASALTSRHARLAAQAADAWTRFMLDTQAAISVRQDVAS